MTDLRRLDTLDITHNGGLCAPVDAAFQEWLARVPEFRGEMCGTEVVPALPIVGLAVAASLLGGLGAGLLRRRRSGP